MHIRGDLEELHALCRPAGQKLHEIGAVALTAIPEAVAKHAPIDMRELHRILASCDAIINDAGIDQAQMIVEAKHRFPFAESRGIFTFMGKRRMPLKEVSVEYFTQCQLQMLVLDVGRCDLISYSLGLSRNFHLRRDNLWCSLALRLLRELHRQQISTKKVPSAAFYQGPVRHLHDALVQQTVRSMQELTEQRVTEVKSAVNLQARDRFLDDQADTDPRKEASRMCPYDMLTVCI